MRFSVYNEIVFTCIPLNIPFKKTKSLIRYFLSCANVAIQRVALQKIRQVRHELHVRCGRYASVERSAKIKCLTTFSLQATNIEYDRNRLIGLEIKCVDW
jgi:hypothetical protein